MFLTKAIQEFLDASRLERGLSINTIEAYATDLRLFLEFQETIEVTADSLVPEILNRFLASDKFSKSTTARRQSTLRQFFKFCCVEYQWATNPAENLDSPGKIDRIPKSIKSSEIQILLEYLATESKAGDLILGRDLAMVLLMYSSGLRVSELVDLPYSSVDLRAGLLRVTGKGQKERMLPFPSSVCPFLENYAVHIRPQMNPTCVSYFVGRRGDKLTRQAFWKSLKTHAIAAGLSEIPHPHQLRHSFATELLSGGMNLRSLQLLLGHSDLSTTQIYTRVMPEGLKEVHETKHPRGGGLKY